MVFSAQHAVTARSHACSSELTAADSVTPLLLTALTSTGLIDIQRAEGGRGDGGVGERSLGRRVEEEKVKHVEKCLRAKGGRE